MLDEDYCSECGTRILDCAPAGKLKYRYCPYCKRGLPYEEMLMGMSVEYIIGEALTTDGGHHKQWYLEVIARKLGMNLDNLNFKRGIAP